MVLNTHAQWCKSGIKVLVNFVVEVVGIFLPHSINSMYNIFFIKNIPFKG